MTASLTLNHREVEGTQLDGNIQLEKLAMAQQGHPGPFLSVPELKISIKDLQLQKGDVSVGGVELAGDPSVIDRNLSPAPRFELAKFKVSVEEASWPERRPARIRVTSGLPKGGALDVGGTMALRPLEANLRARLRDVDLSPYQAYIPVSVPVSGKADTDMIVVASMGGDLKATVRGKGVLRRLAMGPRDAPVVAVEQASATDVDVRWPSRIRVGRIQIRKPTALVERDESGALPLRAMFTPPTGRSGGKPEGQVAPASRPPSGSPSPKPAIEFGEIEIEEGYARFVDRTGTPPYSEELSRLAVKITGLSNAPGKRGQLSLQSVVGATGALGLQGEIAPLGESLFVDLEGELRDFAIPRVNPYTNRILAWMARDGQLATKLHFRIDGDRLDAKSEIVVGRLDLIRAGAGDEAQKRIGLPLGLIVALMKDVRGEIRVSVPVSGSLSSPEFSLGEAVWTAVRNVIVNVLAAPFKLIGGLFTKDNRIAELKVDPIIFDPGSGVLMPPMEQQAQRIADFMRNSPFVRIGLSPVVSQADLAVLKTQEVTQRIQRLQREQQLGDLGAAAGKVFKQKHPNRAVPKTVEEIVAALSDSEPTPEEAGHKLSARRIEVTLERLTKSGRIEEKRLELTQKPPDLPGSGEGRVEFTIVP
jgi:hypothetical protein